MSFRFQKRISLFPGVRLNLSRSGMSVSVGIPGATLNFGGRSGTSITVGIPGSGLSYRHHFVASPSDAPDLGPSQPAETPFASQTLPAGLQYEIKSAAVSALTTPDLEGLKELINDAAAKRRESERSVTAALKFRDRTWRSLERTRKIPLRLLLASRIPRKEAVFEQAQTDLAEEAAKLDGCHVEVDFAFDELALGSYAALVASHRELRRCERIWDITTSTFVDRVKTRSAASSSVTRQPVSLSDVNTGIVASRWAGIQFENMNGADIEIYPGFCLMRESTGQDYALIDIREVDLRFREQQFIEDDVPPKDSALVGYAWEKSNKDGSRDRRFSDNCQRPIMKYGQIEFRTAQGLNEAYLASNSVAAEKFVAAFTELQSSLRKLATSSDLGKTDSTPALIGPAPKYQIPALPNVRGAHEYTFALGLLAAGLTWLWLDDFVKTPVKEMSSPKVEISGTSQPPTPKTTDVPATSSTKPLESSTKPPIAESVRTLQRANIRSGPNTTTAILKTIDAGVVLKVFDRAPGWVQVGNDQPIGWISATLLGPK